MNLLTSGLEVSASCALVIFASPPAMSTEAPRVAHYDDTITTPGVVFTIRSRFVDRHGILDCEEWGTVIGRDDSRGVVRP